MADILPTVTASSDLGRSKIRGPYIVLQGVAVAIAVGGWACASAASAQEFETGEAPGIALVDIITELAEQSPSPTFVMAIKYLEDRGYTIEDVSLTMLNRVRIVARNDAARRMVVVSRSSGLVLYDGVLDTFTPVATTMSLLPPDIFIGPDAGADDERYPKVPE